MELSLQNARRFIWFNCVHVRTATFFLGFTQLIAHLTILILLPLARSTDINADVLIPILNPLTAFQWEGIVAKLRPPQFMKSGFLENVTSGGISDLTGEIGRYGLLYFDETKII